MPAFTQNTRSFCCINGPMLGINESFPPDLYRGRVLGKLKNHDLTFVQLFGVVETGIRPSRESNHMHAIFLGLDHKIILIKSRWL